MIGLFIVLPPSRPPRYGRVVVSELAEVYHELRKRGTRADSDQSDALADPPGLMVRSRDLRPTQIPQPSCAASRTMGPPILREGATRRLRSRKRSNLRPPPG